MAISAFDMTGVQTDSDPSTVAHWNEGGWSGYEDNEGTDRTNTGGFDQSLYFEATTESLDDPFVVEAGTSSAWYDPTHDGEDFMLEILADNLAVMYWFTYNADGDQDWYIATGEIRGNRILFPELLLASGGEFGPGFDPEKLSYKVVGSASFIWADCDNGAMSWLIDNDGYDRRQGRMSLQRISNIMGIECGNPSLPPEIDEGWLSGSWYDPSHDGEGFVLEILTNQNAVVYWFSYDQEGNRRWFFGIGEIQGSQLVFNEMFSIDGGIFGDDIVPDPVEYDHWGTLELDLQCESGIAGFTPIEMNFPAGTLDVIRLSFLEGLNCDN